MAEKNISEDATNPLAFRLAETPDDAGVVCSAEVREKARQVKNAQDALNAASEASAAQYKAEWYWDTVLCIVMYDDVRDYVDAEMYLERERGGVPAEEEIVARFVWIREQRKE
ncbi:hypothetical protein HDV00_011033 [Rhizophlyctis rosea]|nr:hypothetical protein HDV00_011033 [Rhizophlyctis rosea]